MTTSSLYEQAPAQLRAARAEGDARRLNRRWGEAIEAVEGAELDALALRLRAAGDLGADAASVDEILVEIRAALHQRRLDLATSAGPSAIASVRRALDTVGALWALVEEPA